MSIRLVRLTRCGLPAVTASLLAVSAAVAEPMYTVTDVGARSDSVPPSGDSSRDVTIPKRLMLNPSGEGMLGARDQPQPGESKGPLPDSLNLGASGGDAAATSRFGNNAAGQGFDKDQVRPRFADVGGPATGTGTGKLAGGAPADAATGNQAPGSPSARGNLPGSVATAPDNRPSNAATATSIGSQPGGAVAAPAPGNLSNTAAPATATLPGSTATAPAPGTLPGSVDTAPGIQPSSAASASGNLPNSVAPASGILSSGATTATLPGATTTAALPGATTTATLPGAATTATLPGATTTAALSGATTTAALPGGPATGNLSGASWGQALELNDKSQVVGLSGAGGQNAQPFHYTQSEGATGLGKAEAGTAADALNNSGQLAGDLAKGSGPTGRTFASFNESAPVDPSRLIDSTSGSTLPRATEVNALGQIGSFGLNALDVMHALRLTPQVAADPKNLVAAATGADDTSLSPTPVSTPPLHADLGFPQPVPEPSVLALFGLVTAGLATRRGLFGRHRSL